MLAAASARANSRYPASKHIFFAPAVHDDVAVRVTYGVLLSRDRGRTWRLICESAIGAGGNQDPMYAWTPSGVIIGTMAEGISISNQGGCGWTFAPGLETPFVDLAANPADGGHVVAFASSLDEGDGGIGDAGDGGTSLRYRSRLWETKDDGKTFAARGPALDPALFGETLDLVASDPDRIYVTAEIDTETAPGRADLRPKARFLVSRDGAATWESHDVPLVGDERRLFIAGVDPARGDRVYLRTWGGETGPARLLVTENAGQTFRVLYQGGGPLPAFALSGDGSQVWVGGLVDGVHAAATTDFAFQKRSAQPVECLALRDDGLWACSDEANGFVVGLSVDEAVTFMPKLHFCDVLGPLECPAGSLTFQRCPPTGPIGCIRDEPEVPRDAGRRDAGGDASTPAGPGEPPPDGCGCVVGAGAAPVVGAFAVLATGAAAWLRRRSRRR